MNDYSQRLVQRIANPRFLRPLADVLPGEECLFPECDLGVVQFALTVNGAGKIETLVYHTQLLGPPLGFLDVIVEFCQGKSRPQLLAITVRELENYLRDENQRPAFAGDLLPTEAILHFFVSAVVRAAAHRSGPGHRAIGPFPFSVFLGLRLSEKIKYLGTILQEIISPVLALDGGTVEILNLSDQQILLAMGGACSSCPGAQGPTLAFIQDIIKIQLPGFAWQISIIE